MSIEPVQPQPPASDETGSLIQRGFSIVDELPLANLFPSTQPLQVELGSGDGSFLVQYAKLHPQWNFIGVERLLGRIRKIEKKSKRLNLTNVRLYRIEASYFLNYLLPNRSTEALHIYFPDPWPKRKHRKNRLINEAFPELARRVLVPKGIVYLRTDDLDYFQQMTRVFDAAAPFEKIPTPSDLSSVITDFEREFHRRGVATNHAAYRLK
jgi:tRNA (guanine-N7-)-methyltransferase